MSRRGNSNGNAVAENFVQLLKLERIKKKIYRTRKEARIDIFDYIEIGYYRSWHHLGDVSPDFFEQASCED